MGKPHELSTQDAYRLTIEKHQSRVGALSRVLALQMGFGDHEVSLIADAAVLHDIGKVFVPTTYMQKPGPLSEREKEVVRQHPIWGYTILSQCSNTTQHLAAIVALQHHENWDGSGYPYGLSGAQISQEARIVSICDVYDALRDDRPYRAGMTHKHALEVITQGDGRTKPSMFDPAVHEAFLACSSELSRVFATS
ncbi:HD-GYP domain-containing protein [Sphingosinicella rhizophila]|uniref:HD-GYP domain-containing protein n=1 Tax=Sphingosinicella rhizophila TaxID=3050082 RepID=A0ABU3QBV5_9SPHN|nr:HD-GYP domain-containing protein [Sphingosinicella sp. GR2756]MDT9600863.1 HD-GYP domain-containing protein [Sphingosinicella sp. GR2756]